MNMGSSSGSLADAQQKLSSLQVTNPLINGHTVHQELAEFEKLCSILYVSASPT